MYLNEKLVIAKNSQKELYLVPKMCNRHGLITGASGTGKTVTLKVMAETFSSAGIPVFLADVKGDLSGMIEAGEMNENIQKRVEKLELNDFSCNSFPCCFFDVFQKNGIPIRTTISEMGPILLSKILSLTKAQEGALNIVFRIADDKKLELVDLKDLRSMLNYIGEHSKEYTTTYGNVSTQSIGAILRSLLVLEEQGADLFFGEPFFDIKDFMKYDADTGCGIINILNSNILVQNPKLYATVLLWLLTELYEKLPEVGDLDKPKLVFFFDEAHLLFNGIEKELEERVIQIVKLIRSKGIGIFFISQSPKDIPNDVLSQLSSRVQHSLRAYTPLEQKALKTAADSFRENPNFKTIDVISELKTGEALVSFLDEEGMPNIVERVDILPPQSKIGPATPSLINNIIMTSSFYEKYGKSLDNETAYEKINQKNKEVKSAKEEKEKEEQIIKSLKKNKSFTKGLKKVTNSTLSSMGREFGKSIIRGLFGTKK